MFSRLGVAVYRWRRSLLGCWLVLVAIGGLAGTGLFDRLQAETQASQRLESMRAEREIQQLTGTGGQVLAVVDGARADDVGLRRELARAVADLGHIGGVARVTDPLSTPVPELAASDGRAALLVVTVRAGLDEATERRVVDEVEARLRALDVGIDGATVRLGGDLFYTREETQRAEADLRRGEAIALPVALVLLVVVYGGVLAAALPLAVALASTAGALGLLLAATALTEVSTYAVNVVTMVGVGLAVDYGLLMVGRFREERAAGLPVPAAVERTVATAGRTVAFSALTVAAALLGLFAFDDPTMRSIALGGIGVVLVALAAGLTLLPALLALAGRRIRPARARSQDQGWFAGLSRLVQRRALPVAALVAIGLAVLASPFLDVRYELDNPRALPRDSQTRQVAEILATRFPGWQAQPVTVLARVDADAAALAGYAKRLQTLDEVAAIRARPGLPAGVTVLDVVPAGQSNDTAEELVGQIRDIDPGFPTAVTGDAAVLADLKRSITERLPAAAAVIVAATVLLLFAMTGSLVVPAKAVVMNLLSLGASFGALVWVFQQGHLAGLLGFDPTGAITVFVPVLVFVFAFGLSMDYEVFLLSRIKELHDASGNNDQAVAVGLQRTGRVITSAALLIVVVFAGFAAGQTLVIKQIGVGLALAVLVDATVVRSLLVPATMKLMGEWNWWAPGPLRRLHRRFGLHEAAMAADTQELPARPLTTP